MPVQSPTQPNASPPPISGMGSAFSAVAHSTSAQAQVAANAAPKSSATPPPSPLVPETGTPTQRAVAVPGGLPTQQSSMLHDLASIALGFSDPVAPGQVTTQQKQVLDAWTHNAHSDYSQFMLNQGLSGTVANPDALFNEQSLVAQAQWSRIDTQGAMTALKLSASDYDAWMKLEAEKKKSMMGKIFGVAEFAAGLAVDVFASWTGVGLVAGSSLMASGAESFANS